MAAATTTAMAAMANDDGVAAANAALGAVEARRATATCQTPSMYMAAYLWARDNQEGSMSSSTSGSTNGGGDGDSMTREQQ